MTNFTFPCASVNGLTTNQKREAIAALRASIKADRDYKRAAAAQKRLANINAKAAKAEARAEKRASAIEKAKARLQKLLDKQNPVGTAARKANKKPSAVKISVGAEANAIAAALVAKRKPTSVSA
jgi:hypothetical protein